ATLAHSIVTRRYPLEMAGRVNTALNTFTFVGIFLGQWGSGIVLNLWPQTASGYDPRGYSYALGALWLVQRAGLAGPRSGRALVEKNVAIARIEGGGDHRAEHQPAQAEGNRGDEGEQQQDHAVEEEWNDVLQAGEEARLHRLGRTLLVEHGERRREPQRHEQ